MEIQQFQPQFLTTSHLIQKSRTALLQSFFFGMSQIYQITVVWKNITCLQSIFPAILLKQGNTFLHQGLRHPLTLILGKQGSNVGNEFWQLKHIIDRVEDKSRVGVCLDTCHTYTAGYDIVNEYDKVFDEFDKTVGFGFLRAIHLNDSKKALGSRVDRHDSIGKGLIGLDFFKRFMKDERFNDMPVILETPDETLWAEEISMLRSFE